MKYYSILKGMLCVTLFFYVHVAVAQISGTIFRDFNANGTKDNSTTFNEPPVKGITIKSYNTSGVEVATTTSDVNGFYIFLGLTLPLRIEFTDLPLGDFSSASGISNSTSVQFYTLPTTSANFGINYPDDYCNNNPFFASSVYVASPGTNGLNGIAAIPYGTTGAGAPSKVDLKTPYSTIGSVWGMAHQRESNTLFTSAFMKRHTAFGTNGTGGIYMITGTNVPLSSATTPYINLQTLATISTGPNTHATDITIDQNNANGSPFDAVGKVSLGDMDISSDGKYLFVVNLFEKKLHRILIGNPAKPSASLTSADVTSWAIPDPCNAAQGTSRPWGLAVHRGKVYLGVICDASVSLSTSNLSATVYEMDPSTTSGNFTSVLNFPLNFLRGAASAAPSSREYWNPWRSVYYKDPTSASFSGVNPQPILSDIDFDTDGSMILAFTDRSGHQLRMNGPIQDGTGSLDPRLAGDILRAGKCSTANTWTIENNASICGGTATVGAGNTQGPGGGEFYFNEQFDYNHLETSQGAVAILRGSNQVVLAVMDPLAIYSAGFAYMNSTTGDVDGKYELVTNGAGAFNKAGALGDVEMLCVAQPIEIGNRVFMDIDSDGIQDAGEMGIDGVRVELWKANTFVAFVNTANGGQFIFNNVLPETDYEIKILAASFPLGKKLTATNTGTGAVGTPADLRDNDAVLVGTDAVIAYKTGNAGQNNHTLDFGFLTCNVGFTLAHSNVSCNGLGNGQITVTTTSGTAPFMYSKDAGVSYQSSNVFSGLAPATYPVWVMDTNGCIKICN